MLLAGAAVTLGVTLVTLLFGHKVLKTPFAPLLGLMSGVQTQPACLSYAVNAAKSKAPSIAYSAVNPSAMIAKIMLATILASLLT